MKTSYSFYKNSNSGELIMKQHFVSDSKLFEPDDVYYDSNRKTIENTPDLIGFVEISEKKFNRESKKRNK